MRVTSSHERTSVQKSNRASAHPNVVSHPEPRDVVYAARALRVTSPSSGPVRGGVEDDDSNVATASAYWFAALPSAQERSRVSLDFGLRRADRLLRELIVLEMGRVWLSASSRGRLRHSRFATSCAGSRTSGRRASPAGSGSRQSGASSHGAPVACIRFLLRVVDHGRAIR